MTEETSNDNVSAPVLEAPAAPEAPTQQASNEINFRDLLPDPYKTMYPEFKKPEDFVKSYDELYRKMGSAINPPKDGAPKEEWDKFYNKLGRPETPDSYKFEVDDNTKIDDDFLNKFKSKAYETGVTQKQAKEMFDWYNRELSETEQKYTQEAEQQKERALADLKVRWGNDYDRKLQEVQGFAKDLMSSDSGYEKIVKYGNDPDFIDLLHNVKSKYAKEDYIAPTNGVFTDRPDLMTEARKLMADSDYKFNQEKQDRVRVMFQKIAEQRAVAKN